MFYARRTRFFFLVAFFSPPLLCPVAPGPSSSCRYTALHSSVCRYRVPGGGTRDCDVSRGALKNTSLSASPQTIFKTHLFVPPPSALHRSDMPGNKTLVRFDRKPWLTRRAVCLFCHGSFFSSLSFP